MTTPCMVYTVCTVWLEIRAVRSRRIIGRMVRIRKFPMRIEPIYPFRHTQVCRDASSHKCFLKECMSRATNALLLSLLVFPGAGHLHLKRRGRALAFIVPTLGAAFFLVRSVIAPATEMANRLVAQGDMPDPLAIAAQLERAGATSGAVELAVYVLLGCWIAAALDAWRLGRQPPGIER